jgi:GT2 family glycosyltransferase/glycosyltransferase involved in cell wall biosynthesis/SAM-dependent methyltransferase
MHDSEKPVPRGANTDPENDLSFTGERVVPGKVEADLFNEHFVRYIYAREFCRGQKVLDTGCGVGYGSAHVAEVASFVVGIDNDARAVGFARGHYGRANVGYLVGDCQRLPFQSQAFDVVTSFELIEHLPDAKRYLEEVRRVLKQSGTLVVSTPNRPVYHEHLGDVTNPFHVREWDLEEFLTLLKVYFKVVEPLGEQHLSAVGILGPTSNPSVPVAIEQRPALASADYFICACSDRPLKVSEMVYVPASANVLLERERHIRSLTKQLNDRETYLARLQPEFEEKAAWANKLNAELAEAQATVHEFRSRAQGLQSKVQGLQSKVDELGVLWSRATRWKRALIFSVLAPLDWIVGGVIIAAELVGRVLRKISSRKAPLVAAQNSAQCSIVIVTWEGKDLLAESLPALLAAVRFHGGEHEIVVVDNGSTDGTEEYLHHRFPEVRVVRNEQNEYFAGGNNLGVQAAKNDVVVLLNNDMIVHKDFLGPLLDGFRSPDVFAIASQVFLADPQKPREETGKTRATFNGCDLDWRHDPISPSDEQQDYVPVLWGHGGAVAVDRQKFLWLGGFDRLYDPFYVEDADLSYQAWKVGWRCLLGVRSKVIHKHRSSTSRFGSQFITQIVRRNHELFIWKNFGDVPKLLTHFLRVFRRRIRQAGVPGIGIHLELRAQLGAVERLPGVLSRKLRRARSTVCTDQEILDITNPPAIPSCDEVYFPRSDSQERPDSSDRVPGQRRILMVCAYMPCLGVHSGGNTMFNLIRTLSKRHRLTVLSFYEKESENEFVPTLSRYCERLELVYRGQSLDAPNVLGLKPREIVYEFYNQRMQRLVAQHLQKGLFDVLQCEFLQTGHFANVDPNIPAVLTNHELLSLSYLNSLKNIPWTSPLRKSKAMVAWMRMLNYEEKLSRRFAAVVVLTRPEREFLSRYAPTVKVYDHPTGVDCVFFSPTEDPPEQGSVLFVGNFRHAPNVGGMMWFLQKVWPGVRFSYPGAKLHIVGGNPPPSIQEAHGREGITVTGWVEDVRPYLQKASVFVAPVFEGVGLRGKVLEAWAMKKAVVGTHLSFEALSASDGENCFLADEPELFASRVCNLLENPGLAMRMGEASRQLVVDSFSWDAFGEVYDKIYSEILEAREGARLSSHSSVLKQEISH